MNSIDCAEKTQYSTNAGDDIDSNTMAQKLV